MTNYLASEAIDFVAQRTLEHVHVIVKYGPAATVRGLTVEGVGHVGLRLLHGLLLVLQQHSWGHQLKVGYMLNCIIYFENIYRFDFSFQYFHITGIIFIFEGAFHLGSVAVLNRCS